MNDSACRSELVLRERRGELSAAERSALALHLGTCETCRVSQLLGRDFDESAALERADGARIVALSELARRWAGGSHPANEPAAARRRPVWRRAALLVAALPLFVAAAASAAFGVYRASSPAADVAPVSPRIAPRSPEPAKQPLARRAAEPAPLPPAPSAAAGVANVRVAPPAPRAADSAAERFERANAARRRGDVARAITLYRELERDFPASPEAAAAELRLGNLLLTRGKASAALEQFDRHLRRAGGLVPEALYGRGRALAALDEMTSERQTWTRMLRDYSSSPYAAHAKRRLETLGRSGAGGR